MIIAVPILETQVAQAEADGGDAGVESDFNGDGWSDTVVGDPFATVAGQVKAGRIVVLYGDADNRVGEAAGTCCGRARSRWPVAPEAGDRFGTALSSGDVDCDGYTDVVVGTPYEDFGTTVDSGYVQVIWGSNAGLGGWSRRPATGPRRPSVSRSGPATSSATRSTCSRTSARAGPGARTRTRWPSGCPGPTSVATNNAGAIAMRAAYDGGNESYWITQDNPGVPGAAEPGDRFGAAVSCNFLTDDDAVDCAIGAPNEDVGTKKDPAGSR